MKILGISNPHFLGVSIATKANCDEWLPAPDLSHYGTQHLIMQISHVRPDLLLVGGWSKGYLELLELLKKGGRSYPIVTVSHSTPFHGSYFHTDWRAPEYEAAFKSGLSDLMAFVHPQTAEYYQKIRKTFALWLPHVFKPEPMPPRTDRFRIGILGTPAWYKNVEGPQIIARDFCKEHQDAEIVTSTGVNKPHEMFLATLASCSVLIHLSHLECYSNTILEAWARGIPVIESASCDGTSFRNPLLDPNDCNTQSNSLRTALDSLDLYKQIERFYDRWRLGNPANKLLHQNYQNLYKLTKSYTNEALRRIIQDYPNREHDVGFFESPFSPEGIPWDQLKE